MWKVRPILATGIIPPPMCHRQLYVDHKRQFSVFIITFQFRNLSVPEIKIVIDNILSITQDDLDYHWPFDEPIQATFVKIFAFIQVCTRKYNSLVFTYGFIMKSGTLFQQPNKGSSLTLELSLAVPTHIGSYNHPDYMLRLSTSMNALHKNELIVTLHKL